MRALVTVAWREIEERRMLFAAAAAASLLPFLVNVVPWLPRHGDPAHPFVEMRQDRAVALDVAQLTEELGDREAECDGLVDFAIRGVGLDAVVFPQQVFVGLQRAIAGAVVQEDDAWPAGDEPATIVAGHARLAEAVQRLADDALGGQFLELDGGGGGIIRADQTIALVPALQHAGRLGAQDGVDSAQLPADFPSHLEQQSTQRSAWLCRLGGG